MRAGPAREQDGEDGVDARRARCSKRARRAGQGPADAARASGGRGGGAGERLSATATCSASSPSSRRDIQPSSTPPTALREVLDRPIKKVPALRGKTVVNLFYEASTRTRSSFEIAEKVLSADSLSIATATSSVTKGETLLDTAKNLEAMNPDMIVVRHASSGAPHFLARHCRSAIVNAGDGAHEHPTQALLDALTLRQKKGRLKGLRVAIVGDILHSRVARSNVWLLTKMGAEVVLCAPAHPDPARASSAWPP